ncbi:MAG: hypothetical protein IPM79_30995 [Polyangiaceae bacterium]|nr:hypothetical protein [Polyangiaceae bacterium]MBK8941912.1 hypothetical protein [Polyangiaceae bacterium]
MGALSLALTAAMMSACGFPEYGFVGEGGSGAAGGGPTGGSGAGPACDGDDDCAATPATPVCNGALGACVECVAGGNTCQLGEYCASGNTCEPGCDADEDCNLGGEGGGAGLPALTCDVPTNQCIGCVIVDGVDSCPEGTVCDNGACVLPCEVGYGNCNDDPGCETLLTTLSNCGVCGAECTNFHGATECVDAACLPTCDEYYQDCDANPNNGCETSLETAASCGGCTSPCDFPNAEDLCPQGTCTLGLCDDGFGNCDGNDANGCETDTNSSSPHCGGCDLPCAPGDFCVDGGCQSACPDPTANCDMSALNGCEVNTDTDGLHCGDCSTVCSAAQTCATGTCAACAGATRDCDDDGANGCEVNTSSDAANCGGCGITCGSDGTCGCASAACSGGAIYLSEDFSDNSRGWQLGTEWQIGPATVSTGHEQGFPDPGVDHTPSSDNGVAGVAIGGNHSIPIHDYYYMTSPVIDLSAAAGTVNLTYWRWLNCDWDPFTTHVVEVFNGSSWVELWTNDSVGNNLITENAWSRWTHDVTAHKNSQFRVRFGYRTDKQGNYLAWIMSGWNVDDVTLSSGACL